MEGTRSCGHDVTTSTLRGPTDGRQRQSTGNGGVRDWMWSPPRVLAPGVGRGAGAALSWGTNGGCWVGRPHQGSSARVRWRWTPQPSAADKLQLQVERGEDPRGAEGLGRAMGGAGGWDEGVTEPVGLTSSNRTRDAASEDAQGLGLTQGDTLFPAQMLWPWDTPRPHAQLPGIQRVWPGAAGAGEVGLWAHR